MHVFSHHGLYIGDDEAEVIHFAGSASIGDELGHTSTIRKTTVREFQCGDTLRLVAYGVNRFVKAFKVDGSS